MPSVRPTSVRPFHLPFADAAPGRFVLDLAPRTDAAWLATLPRTDALRRILGDIAAWPAALRAKRLPHLPLTTIHVRLYARSLVPGPRASVGRFVVGSWGISHWRIDVAYLDTLPTGYEAVYQLATTVLHELLHANDFAQCYNGRTPHDAFAVDRLAAWRRWPHDEGQIEATAQGWAYAVADAVTGGRRVRHTYRHGIAACRARTVSL